ncbi:MAG: hypothetical protein AAF441_16825 [Pseudomonadota bacterium]
MLLHSSPVMRSFDVYGNMRITLDPATEAEIVSNIRGLSDRYTIVTVTHRPAWTEIADRLYRVEAGNVSLVAGSQAADSACKPSPQAA